MDLLLLTADPNPEAVLPSLSLLAHTVRVAPTEVSSLMEASNADIAIVDARTDLAAARGLCRLLGSTGSAVPVAAVLTEGGLVAVNADWGLDEFLLPATGPAELDARLRLLVVRTRGVGTEEASGKVTLGELVIDEGTYTARLRGRPLDLTYKEFELLKYLAQNAAGCSPAHNYCKRCGVTTFSAAPEPSTSMSDACAPNSAASTSRSSGPCATSDIRQYVRRAVAAQAPERPATTRSTMTLPMMTLLMAICPTVILLRMQISMTTSTVGT